MTHTCIISDDGMMAPQLLTNFSTSNALALRGASALIEGVSMQLTEI